MNKNEYKTIHRTRNQHFAIAEWEKGVNTTQVFINAGSDSKIIGDYRIKSGRPLARELSLEEQPEIKEARLIWLLL